MLAVVSPAGTIVRVWGLVIRFCRLLQGNPLLSVTLSILSFSFFGPVAALVLVATILDHEFAHRFMMQRLGYKPGPVRLTPFLGAHVRAGRPMVRSADIALVYLAGPLAGIVSASGAALLASHTLSPAMSHMVNVGAAVSIALNLFNLIPIEPLDGGLIARVLPYPALLLFPGALAVWLWHSDMSGVKLEVLLLAGVTVITARKIQAWRRYVRALRVRAAGGDSTAALELHDAFVIPLLERIVVISTYLLLVPIALILLQLLSRGNAWLA
ncbi:MAG: hypothetical protein NVSMB65_04320 [Chloroflexota bacterium]